MQPDHLFTDFISYEGLKGIVHHSVIVYSMLVNVVSSFVFSGRKKGFGTIQG